MSRRLLAIALLLALPLFAAEKPQPPADLTAPPADAEKFDSGLVTRVLAPGSGEKFVEGKIVRVRYTVWKSTGELVQHIPAGQAMMLTRSKMLPGWGEAVSKMVVGESRRAWVPASLAAGKIPEGQSFVIDTDLVELLDPPTTPEDVAAPPADATVTESGLAYKVLRPGTGIVHPNPRNTVSVHYSGWTTDGQMFDSSILRGQPAEFGLDGVIKGWTEGLRLMVVGEKTRFWIPGKLAYGNQKGKPQGMLVFDIDLLAIR